MEQFIFLKYFWLILSFEYYYYFDYVINGISIVKSDSGCAMYMVSGAQEEVKKR